MQQILCCLAETCKNCVRNIVLCILEKKQFSICCTMSQSNVLLNAFFCVLTANTPKHEPMCAEYSGVCSVECGLWSVECGGWCVGVCIYRVWSAERATRHIVHTQHHPTLSPHNPSHSTAQTLHSTLTPHSTHPTRRNHDAFTCNYPGKRHQTGWGSGRIR